MLNFQKHRQTALGPMILLTALIVTIARADTIVRREWRFASSAEVQFTIPDTLRVTIRFPNAVPDDRLPGYCRFAITVLDSNAGPALPNFEFVNRIRLDAGFLYFDHSLTFEMNCRGGLCAAFARDPGRLRMMLDPWPASGLHQWFAITTFAVDTAAGVIRFVYNHPKYVAGPALAKSSISSSGYPFEYGVFASQHNSIRAGPTDAGLSPAPARCMTLVFTTRSCLRQLRSPANFTVDGRLRTVVMPSIILAPHALTADDHDY